MVGIIGRNGAGKSTLLKILSRITEPTEGCVRIRGRVASLLEVGTGFHPELTGRENIYVNGAILGMTRQEISAKFDEIVAFGEIERFLDTPVKRYSSGMYVRLAVLGMTKAEIKRKFDAIVAFAEIEKFLDTPVKRYSSGMYMRLAFAVAAHLEPEILIVDEVLAVGDAAFQKKCLGKMGTVAREGRTVLFVSHNMAAVENLCRETILLDAGALIRRGDSRHVITFYLERLLSPSIGGFQLAEQKDRTGDGRIRLTSFYVEDVDGNKLSAARSGMDLVFVFGFKCQDGDSPRNVDVGLAIDTTEKRVVFRLYRSYSDPVFKTVPSSGAFRCYIAKFPLSPGRYTVIARITVGGDEADWPRDGVGYLDVEAGDFYGTGKQADRDTLFLVSGKWELRDPNESAHSSVNKKNIIEAY